MGHETGGDETKRLMNQKHITRCMSTVYKLITSHKMRNALSTKLQTSSTLRLSTSSSYVCQEI